MSILGERMKLLRDERELTQEQLGALFFVNKGTVSKWEKGTRSPNLETIEKLSDFFDVSVDFLLGRTNKRKPNHLTKEELIELAPEYAWLFEEEGLEYVELVETMKTEDVPPDLVQNVIDMILQTRNK